MKDFRGTRAHLELEQSFWQEKAKLIIARYPKLAIKIWAQIGTPQKIIDALRIPLRDDIVTRPYFYQASTAALEIYLDHLHQSKLLPPSKEIRGTLSEWRAWDFVRMIRYLGFRYNGEYFMS